MSLLEALGLAPWNATTEEDLIPLRGIMHGNWSHVPTTICSQLAGVDYEEAFSWTAEYASIRCGQQFSAHYSLSTSQMDVKFVFMNGDLM